MKMMIQGVLLQVPQACEAKCLYIMEPAVYGIYGPGPLAELVARPPAGRALLLLARPRRPLSLLRGASPSSADTRFPWPHAQRAVRFGSVAPGKRRIALWLALGLPELTTEDGTAATSRACVAVDAWSPACRGGRNLTCCRRRRGELSSRRLSWSAVRRPNGVRGRRGQGWRGRPAGARRREDRFSSAGQTDTRRHDISVDPVKAKGVHIISELGYNACPDLLHLRGLRYPAGVGVVSSVLVRMCV